MPLINNNLWLFVCLFFPLVAYMYSYLIYVVRERGGIGLKSVCVGGGANYKLTKLHRNNLQVKDHKLKYFGDNLD